MFDNVFKPFTTFVIQIGAVIALALGLNGCTPTKAEKPAGSEVPAVTATPTSTSPQSPVTSDNKTQSTKVAGSEPVATETSQQSAATDNKTQPTTATVNVPESVTATTSDSSIVDRVRVNKTLAANSSKQPFTIFIGIDRTGSTVSSKIPTLKFPQLERLARAAARVGVEIRLGVICTDSDRPLLAFFVPEPPVAPQTLPSAPTSASVDNMLKLPRLRANYEKVLVAHQQAEAEYQKKVAAREQLIETEIANFKRGFELLQNKTQCGATDIYGMLKRADLYLNEVNPTWTQTPRKLALVITDGIETVNSTKPQPLQWTSKAEVILVSSGGEVGILKPLLSNVVPYESIDGAIRSIVAE
jgi:hypothetical protein